MIRELMSWLTVRCPRHLRAMGYAREIVATEARHERLADLWAPHLSRCRAVVGQAVEQCRDRHRAIVLGAGLVADTPVDLLADLFGEVALVDVVHLGAARDAAKRHANVHLIAHDVTESLRDIHALKLEAAAPAAFLDDSQIDLVVSANIASQLPLLPMHHLERHGVSERDSEALGQRLITAHFHWLSQFDAQVALITDIERIIRNRDNATIGTVTALLDAEVPALDEDWLWEIEPIGEVDHGHRVTNRVGATANLKKSAHA